MRKEIIKITNINEKEERITREKMSQTRSWFFEKINNIIKSLARPA